MEYVITIREVNEAQIVVSAENVEEAEAKALAQVEERGAYWVYGEPEVIASR